MNEEEKKKLIGILDDPARLENYTGIAGQIALDKEARLIGYIETLIQAAERRAVEKVTADIIDTLKILSIYTFVEGKLVPDEKQTAVNLKRYIKKLESKLAEIGGEEVK